MILSFAYIRGFRSYILRKSYSNPYLIGTYDYNEFERGYFQAQKRRGLYI